jgi:hypothetical protein
MIKSWPKRLEEPNFSFLKLDTAAFIDTIFVQQPPVTLLSYEKLYIIRIWVFRDTAVWALFKP